MRRPSNTALSTALPALVVGGLAWTAIHLQRGVKAAYYEWGITCIIASYAEEHDGSPPRGWDDLVGYGYHSKYLPVPRTIKAAAAHVHVDFDALRAFARGTIPELPASVVIPTRGIEMHWTSPKTILERYFRNGERPDGSFNAQEAEQLRSVAEAAN